jgi:hypothetical protein
VRPATLFVPALLVAALAGCSKNRELDETGGLRVTRSTCPAVAIPAYTGDVSLFSPEQSQDARALDVAASITNLRPTCDESGARVRSTVTFDVVARRANPAGARDVTLPYFATVVRAGNRIVSKQTGQVVVHFADGQPRATASATAGADIDRAAASLPANVSARLNRKRKATDQDASIDPMNEPSIRAAVNQANFELLVGFQLSQPQLAYNATK